MLKPRLQALFDDYTANHMHPVNRLTHKVAIPLIVLHLVAMLDWVRLVPVAALPGGALTLGMLAALGGAAWFLAADAKLGALVTLFMVACFPVGRALPMLAVVAIAALGWLVQLAGHAVWEKKSPSFLTNLVHALVGPMFFVALLTGDYQLPTAALAPARR